MTPEEFEHTREPAYDRVDYWLPMFLPQRSLGIIPRPASSETSDANSSSQEGSNTPNILSSRDTSPPNEKEPPLQSSIEEDFIEGETVQSTNQLVGVEIPKEANCHEKRMSMVDSSLPVDTSNTNLAITPLDKTLLGKMPIEPETRVSNDGLPSPQAALDVRKHACVNTALNQGINIEACEKGPVYSESELETNKLLDESVAHEIAIDIKGEEIDIVNIETPFQPLSVAITCPSTYTATDPPASRLRYLIAHSSSIILCPGVYDGLSARIALQVGFKSMYMTGAGTTASCLGASDLGIAQLHEMRTNAEMIANLQPDGPPLIADMDTGYGGPLIIRRAVQQYARAGVAAFHIEDQVAEKRCGHLAGKEVVDTETYLRRIKACVYARAQIRSDIIIIARTDALQSRGYDECVDRLRRARDLGADMGILEGVSSKEMAARAVKDLAPWPLCYNSVENGHSPLITAAEAQEMGYRVMIFSFAGIAPAYAAILDTFTRLKEYGVTGNVVGPKKIFEVCGLEEEMRMDAAAGGVAFAKGV